MAINIIQGFNPSTTEPIDSRQLVANSASRFDIATFNAYEGMIVYQQDTKVLWVLTDIAAISGSGGWSPVGSGSTAPAAGYDQFDGLITTEENKLGIINLYDPEGWNPIITSGSTGTYLIDFRSPVLRQNLTHVQISAGISPTAPGADVIVAWAFDYAGDPRQYINLYTFQNKALKDYLLLNTSITVKVY
jgi:hypothetical protein